MGLEKKKTALYKISSSKEPTNAKIPHLREHKPKLLKWGTAIVIFTKGGDPIYIFNISNIIYQGRKKNRFQIEKLLL